MADSFETRIERLKTIRDAYENDLLADAVSGTQPDYSLDGESVSRDAWRAGLQKRIDEIDEKLQRLEPFEFGQNVW
jgi:hypothetical protein